MTQPYRIFPHATKQERADLLSSIGAVGLSCPVIVDEHGQIIDGHERQNVCEEVGIDWMAGADVRIGLSEYQKKALAIELNMWRRPMNLTRRQRNELLEIYLIANPQLSETIVAELFGVNQSHVNRRKRAVMAKNNLPKPTATVGKDGVTRLVGNRQQQARMIVKSRAEFESLQPALATLRGDLNGQIRRPKKLIPLARRKTALASVNDSPKVQMPQNCRIEHCDFRNLIIDDNSVDAIITDVVWGLDAEPDWRDLAQCAKRWLKPNGIFCSIIGNETEPYFSRAMMKHFTYQATIAIVFPTVSLPFGCGFGKQYRPAVILANSETFVLPRIVSNVIFAPKQSDHEKDYHDWQQRLDVCMELMKRLTKPGDVIVDPHLGTGTNAVAAALLGERTFIGCDIDEQQVRTARYRVATEGHLSTVNSPQKQRHEVTA